MHAYLQLFHQTKPVAVMDRAPESSARDWKEEASLPLQAQHCTAISGIMASWFREYADENWQLLWATGGELFHRLAICVSRE